MKIWTPFSGLEGGGQPQGSWSSVGWRGEGVGQVEVVFDLCYCRKIGKWTGSVLGSPLVCCDPRGGSGNLDTISLLSPHPAQGYESHVRPLWSFKQLLLLRKGIICSM